MFKWLNRHPSEENRKLLLRISPIFLIIMFVLVQIAFFISNYPVFFVESQLSFSGETIKGHFAQMDEWELTLYAFAQIVDFFFMLAYGSFFFSIALTISRKFVETSRMRSVGNFGVIIAILAPICDAIENIFIFLMLLNPNGFPNAFAIAHSVFSSFKFASMIIGFSILIYLVIQSKKRST